MAKPTNYDQVMVDIKNYVYHYRIQTPAPLDRARIALLDAIGCAIETVAESEECRRLLGPNSIGTVTPDGFKLPGTSYQLDPVKGAFDFGTLIRYLDHNDALGGKDWGHPSDNLGAILSVTDWLDRSSQSGRQIHTGPVLNVGTLLEAIIKAYEIQGLFLMENAFNQHGLDHTILVKLASTAVISWLMGLTEEEAVAAISQVFMDNSPLRVYRSGHNTVSRKGWAAGDACMRAVHIALLTQKGQQGAPGALTAPRWGFYDALWGGNQFSLSRPYGTLAIELGFFKLISSEGHGISAIEAAVKLSTALAERGIDPVEGIAKLKIRTTGSANMIINKTGVLVNSADRDHCIQYLVAVTLLKGSVIETGDYLDSSPWATDHRVDSLRNIMEVYEDESFTRDYHNLKKRSVANGLTATLQDGFEMEEVLVEYPIGHSSHPMTAMAVEEKFAKNMGRMFSNTEIDRIRAAVCVPEKPIRELVDLLVRPSATVARL